MSEALSATGSAPLGRYGPQHEDGAALVRVQLVDAPTRLWRAATEHHDEVLREMSLLAMHPSPSRSPRLVELVDQLGRRYAAATDRPEAQIATAIAQGLDRIDLSFDVPVTAGPAATAMDALLAEAEALCRESGELLALPRPEVLDDFAHWYVGEFVTQCAGGPPTPWPGPWTL